MVKARHIIHIFFSSGESPQTLGIIRFGATEIYLFHTSTNPPSCTEEIEKNISCHKIQLPQNNQNSITKISETLEDIIRENTQICVNLNNTFSLLGAYALMNLSEYLEEFHQFDRPSLGRYATIFAYQIKNSFIDTIPIIPQNPDLCPKIFRILSQADNGLSKRDLIDKFADLGEDTSIDQVTNALIILENWLTFYPGFEVEQLKQRRKIYRLQQ